MNHVLVLNRVKGLGLVLNGVKGLRDLHIWLGLLTCIVQINVREHSNEKFSVRCTFLSRKRHADLISGSLTELWHIDPKRDKATITATTKNGIQSEIMPLIRHYRYDRIYNLKRLQGSFAANILFADIKSLQANTCCQVY